jgi:hypothetical protein
MAGFDGVVIGAGHNGLTVAAYLSRAGLKIAVVERNPRIGGGCTTEEPTLPGYRFNLHSNFFRGLRHSPLLHDLELYRFGFSYIEPPIQQGAAFRDGTCVVIHKDLDKTCASLARFSARDAETFRELHFLYAVKMRPLLTSLAFNAPLPIDQLKDRLSGTQAREFLSHAQHDLFSVVRKHCSNMVTSDLAHSPIWTERWSSSMAAHTRSKAPAVCPRPRRTLARPLPSSPGSSRASMSRSDRGDRRGDRSTVRRFSISGDGGFLYSAMELETAVRLNVNFVHLVWVDGAYDMVAIQERLKFGRTSGVNFGPIDYVKYAEACGAHGMLIKRPDEIAPVMKKAFDMAGPVIVGAHVDYTDNHKLFEMVRGDSIH